MMIHKRKTCGLAVMLLFIALLMSGCTQLLESETTNTNSNKEPAEITLKPIDLFKGAGAKFQPFLGSMSGAFELHYEGKKPNARLDIDLWENGKKVSSYGSIGDLFFSSEDDKSQKVEIIIAMDPTTSNEDEDPFTITKVASIHGASTSLVTFTIPRDKKLTASGLVNYQEPVSFMADEDEHVWGLQATSSGMMRMADFSPDSLAGLEWAIIFTLRFEK
ncbi:hypothetical protein [Paenibacillus sinopodophylli]|uniref:hypothetical protein n=1 Tax=Paenibacillus sinopodophylli TaxID=1837342 RepID=UPI00110CF7A2|nr:hypothetical protein [Paenibacillus sinopodophylli]